MNFFFLSFFFFCLFVLFCFLLFFFVPFHTWFLASSLIHADLILKFSLSFALLNCASQQNSAGEKNMQISLGKSDTKEGGGVFKVSLRETLLWGYIYLPRARQTERWQMFLYDGWIIHTHIHGHRIIEREREREREREIDWNILEIYRLIGHL